MDNERLAGGLLCSEVLALLSEYVDGELDSQTAAAVDEHLSACDNCLRFGGSFLQMMSGLHRAGEPIPVDVIHRLEEKLRSVPPEE